MSGDMDHDATGTKRKKPPSTPHGGFVVHRRAADGRIKTPKRRGMYEHASFDDACDEAGRLAEALGGTFSVFEVVHTVRKPERPAPVVDKPAAPTPADPSTKVKATPAAPPKTNRTPVVEVRRRRAKSAGAK
ncbi:hypothetical protein ASF53_19555 [Methylobacterium sp. Leaf123]|uniref:hypothetical protein n=1 Tax=Methylobacterium sp. Leaf123 TaxID=1736264 RepID=UPI0006FF6795|nr:hypothetical protein [Methylobacterium sp. Leaf123]KQQ29430.1 hypothetical protein ASF53_19555 [Methylobacterium sp. Leaf123]